jgi:hypothetical protein
VHSEIELEFRSVDFYGGRKTGGPGEKPLWQGREPNIQSYNIIYFIKLGSHLRKGFYY